MSTIELAGSDTPEIDPFEIVTSAAGAGALPATDRYTFAVGAAAKLLIAIVTPSRALVPRLTSRIHSFVGLVLESVAA